jgi:hypothetical protein
MTTAELRRRLAELDAAIIEQKASLQKLERDRSIAQHQLHRTLTFPVLTLPVEITAEIFSLCRLSHDEEREDYWSMSRKHKTQAPTVFLGVCRTWRDIALGTPALWTKLSLDSRRIKREVASRAGEIEGWIDRWFDRAALCPLSIALFVEPESLFTPARVRNIIQRYASRVQYLELVGSRHAMHQLDLDSVAFPLLRRAVLGRVPPGGPFENFLHPVSLFNHAPQLRDLRLLESAEFFYYTPPALQLTVFEGQIDELDLFTLAPNLTHARLCVECITSTPPSAISHARLQSLSFFTSCRKLQAFDILQHLTLPALQTLHILEVEDTTYSTLHAFLTRSSPPLTTLSIHADSAEFVDWQECISCVADTLEHLKLDSPSSEVQLTIF